MYVMTPNHPREAQSLETRPQTRAACLQILRYIRAHHVRPGQQLPTDVELRGKLSLCSNTLASAMAILAMHGVVSRKRRVGTVFHGLHLRPDAPHVFVVGVLIASLAEAGFTHTLNALIRYHLRQRGCEDRTYVLRHDAPSSAKHEFVKIDDYPWLDRDLRDQRTDALLSVNRVEPRAGIPICHLNDVPGGWCVLLNRAHLITAGSRVLRELGCQRLAVMYTPFHSEDRYDLDRQATHRAIVTAGLNPDQTDLILTKARSSPDEAMEVLYRNRTVAERPDAVLITDDHLAANLTQAVAATDWRPRLVVQTNRQLPVGFALPVIRFEFDLDEYARKAAELMLDVLLNPSLQPEMRLVMPRLCEEDLLEVDAAGIARAIRQYRLDERAAHAQSSRKQPAASRGVKG